VLRDLLCSEWLWITIFGCIAVILFPYIVIFVLLQLPFPFNAIMFWLIIVGWGIAAGYKDWQLYKKKEEKWAPRQDRAKPNAYPT